MREIKFRAWHEYGKLNNKGIPCTPGMIYDEKPGDCLHWKSQGQMITDVMQYTGVKANGKEIYEGDIIHRINRSSCCGKIKYEETQIVKWEGTGFYGFPLPDNPLGSCGFADIDSEDASIIGNIHENPELLTTDI